MFGIHHTEVVDGLGMADLLEGPQVRNIWTTGISPPPFPVCIADIDTGASRVVESHRMCPIFHVCQTEKVSKMVVLTSAPGLSGVHAHREVYPH